MIWRWRSLATQWFLKNRLFQELRPWNLDLQDLHPSLAASTEVLRLPGRREDCPPRPMTARSVRQPPVPIRGRLRSGEPRLRPCKRGPFTNQREDKRSQRPARDRRIFGVLAGRLRFRHYSLPGFRGRAPGGLREGRLRERRREGSLAAWALTSTLRGQYSTVHPARTVQSSTVYSIQFIVLYGAFDSSRLAHIGQG